MRLKKYAAAALAAVMAMSMAVSGEEESSAPEETVTEEESFDRETPEDGEEQSEEETTESGEEIVLRSAAGGETEYPLTVQNSDGTEVVIEEEPERVISLGPNITEMMFALGAGDKLAARTEYCDYPEEALELPTIGTMSSPDIEAILAKEPDLVVASALIADDVLKQLEEAGIPSMYLYEEKDVKGVYGMIDTLGMVMNCQDAAVEAVETMQEKIAGVAKALENLEDPATVYYVVSFGEYGDYTAGKDTYVNGILTLAGAENAAADVEGWSYSTEKLLEKDPDYIILADYYYNDFLTTDPYTELTAVKLENALLEEQEAEEGTQSEEDGEAADGENAGEAEHHLIVLDINTIERQSVRNADAIEEIAHRLYPELFEEKAE